MRTRAAPHMRRLLGFGLMPAMSVMASLVLLPLIAHRFGSSAWIALTIGQGVGAIAAVVIAMAWPVIGGNMVASAAGTVPRRQIYRMSVSSRTLVFLVLSPAIVAACVIFAGSDQLAATLFGLGFALNGLSASWYYAGQGTPSALVWNEGVVRLVSYAVAVAAVLSGLGLWVYGLITLVASIAMYFLNWRTIMGRHARMWQSGSAAEATRVIRQQLGGTLSRVLQAAYYYGSPIIFAGVARPNLPVYAAADQVKRTGSNALSLVPTTFVSWVGEAGPAQRRERQRKALATILVACALAILGWFVLGDVIMGFLFASKVTLSWQEQLALVLGITMNLLCSAVELLILVPNGREGLVFNANSVVCLVGIPLLAVLAIKWGVLGGLLSLVLVKSALLVIYRLSTLRNGVTHGEQPVGIGRPDAPVRTIDGVSPE